MMRRLLRWWLPFIAPACSCVTPADLELTQCQKELRNAGIEYTVALKSLNACVDYFEFVRGQNLELYEWARYSHSKDGGCR